MNEPYVSVRCGTLPGGYEYLFLGTFYTEEGANAKLRLSCLPLCFIRGVGPFPSVSHFFVAFLNVVPCLLLRTHMLALLTDSLPEAFLKGHLH